MVVVEKPYQISRPCRLRMGNRWVSRTSQLIQAAPGKDVDEIQDLCRTTIHREGRWEHTFYWRIGQDGTDPPRQS